MLITKQKKINNQIVAFDNLRRNHLVKGDIKKYINTYKKKYDVNNLNTGSLWDNIHGRIGLLAEQSPMTKCKISYIASRIPLAPLRILDIGIGQGFIEEILFKRNVGYKFYGIDISQSSVESAKKRFGGSFIKDDALAIDRHFRNEFADVVVMIEILEHISPSKVFLIFRKINAALKNKGLLIASVPINERLYNMNDNPNAHVRDYSFDILSKELELSGFRIVEKKYLYAFNSLYFLKSILSHIFTSRWSPNSLTIVAEKVDYKTKKSNVKNGRKKM